MANDEAIMFVCRYAHDMCTIFAYLCKYDSITPGQNYLIKVS